MRRQNATGGSESKEKENSTGEKWKKEIEENPQREWRKTCKERKTSNTPREEGQGNAISEKP